MSPVVSSIMPFCTPVIFLDRMGYGIDLLPVNRDGAVSSSMLEDHLQDDAILVSVMLANNEIGTIQPLENWPKLRIVITAFSTLMLCRVSDISRLM